MDDVAFGPCDFQTWRTAAAGQPLYAPLLATPPGGLALGRLAQSLDGRIATGNGASRWISGREDILHTHRLRALFDAVLVGAGTVAADDPQLTTRDVPGRSPVRVILDAQRRLPAHHRVFQDGPATLLACAEEAGGDARHGRAEVLRLPCRQRRLDPHDVLAALAARGLRRVFVEGGGITVSHFLAAGALDRLHVTVAPLLLGSGIPAFTLPGATAPDDGLRLDWTVHTLGRDLLLDIPLLRTA
jgi:riboflavin-specific deaminase-like protein